MPGSVAVNAAAKQWSSSTTSSTSAAFAAAVQHGIASLVATATATHTKTKASITANDSTSTSSTSTSTSTTTSLTRISHQAPYRLIPLRSSSVSDAGAAVCYLSNYGGGLLPGDSLDLSVHVQPNAKLGVVTQGSTRIYRQRHDRNDHHHHQGGRVLNVATTPTTTTTTRSCSKSKLMVDSGGLLVLTPDPVTPFAESFYEQHQHIQVHPEASICVVDWFSAGRFTNGERWQHNHLSNRTEFYMSSDNTTSTFLVFVDSVRFDRQSMMMLDQDDHDDDNGSTSSSRGFSCNACANLILYGHQMQDVVERCRTLQHQLMQPFTRTRTRTTQSPINNMDSNNSDMVLSYLASRVLMSLSEIPTGTPTMSRQFPPNNENESNGKNKNPSGDSSVYLARWAAASNEDLYRLLHFCLQPLVHQFGYEFYKDRIRARYSAPIFHNNTSSSRNSMDKGSTATSSSINESDSSKGSATTKIFKSSDDSSSESSLQLSNNKMNSSSSSAAAAAAAAAAATSSTTTTSSFISSAPSLWSAFMLADSALPVGSFAHSNGIEAAAQLQLLSSSSSKSNKNFLSRTDRMMTTTPNSTSSSTQNDFEKIQRFVTTSTKSTLELYTPFVLAIHHIFQPSSIGSCTNITEAQQQDQQQEEHEQQRHLLRLDEWKRLDQELHARLVSNPPVCRASLDQGRSLLRVYNSKIISSTATTTSLSLLLLLEEIQSLLLVPHPMMTDETNKNAVVNARAAAGHLVSIFGLVTCLEGMDSMQACHLLGYCVARDLVSAAVRLNLIGPMASVRLLAQSQQAALDGMEAAREQQQQQPSSRSSSSSSIVGDRNERVNSNEEKTMNDILHTATAYSSSCAPLLDLIQPCHDLLATRLFRT